MMLMRHPNSLEFLPHYMVAQPGVEPGHHLKLFLRGTRGMLPLTLLDDGGTGKNRTHINGFGDHRSTVELPPRRPPAC